MVCSTYLLMPFTIHNMYLLFFAGCMSHLGVRRWYLIYQALGNSIVTLEVAKYSRGYNGRPVKAGRTMVHT